MGEGPNMSDGRSAREVERDIERTRHEMGTTIDALEDKLSPGEMLDQVSGWVKRGALTEQVREHPVPLALIGAGIGWLLVENLTGTSSGPRRRTGWEDDRHPDPWQSGSGRSWSDDDLAGSEGDGGNGRTVRDKAAGVASSLHDRAAGAGAGAADRAAEAGRRAAGAAGAARDKVSDLGDDVRARASELGHRASERWEDARHAAGRGAVRARRGFWNLVHENPLAVGGAAAAVGFIAGLSAPSTHAEDRLMGDAASTLKHHAKEAGREAVDTAQKVARDTAEAVRRETERDDGRSLTDKVTDAGRAATAEARRSAERHDATPERAREKAREAASDMRKKVQDRAEREKPGGSG